MTDTATSAHEAAMAASLTALGDVLAEAVGDVDAALTELKSGRPRAAVGTLFTVDPLLARAARLYGSVIEIQLMAAEHAGAEAGQ